ncbi:putative nucleotidyltransferase substrate binding domain-containing protein [Azospirillum halopraeferens]|uniref:putative nucleotidyltransferase substrate binding domain-containing protein n=1 Tax=Azospirillum halopraeferens TaxID=34010 RepID=UPI0004074CD7|nr:putative nucleotidyltransferase substrate binding domain-containing protein [Azospirillum halopraeferens]
MDAAKTDISAFLGVHHPFDLLPADVLAEIAGTVTAVDLAPGTVVMNPGDAVDCLYVVRSGAVETRDPDGQLLARLGEGECFGVRAILRGGVAVNRSDVIEDARLLRLPVAVFDRLRRDHPPFAYHFAAFDGGRLRDSYESTGAPRNLDLLTKRVGALITRGPVTIDAAASVHEAACVMRDQRVSCVLVTEGGALTGILTDRDLRGRVVAERLDYATPVARVMTHGPHRVQASDHAFDALLLMTRHNIHHLPVMDGDAVTGCLTGSALVDSHTTSPLFLARNIHTCTTAEELRAVILRVPDLVHEMADWGGTARGIGRVVTTLTDATTLRLLHLAEQRLGPPPVPYVWMAAGSQARQEQTALSDQDNCLILSDDFREAEHGAYFRDLSRFVCDGLNTCGYIHCPGEMMAMTDQWRQPLAVWKEYFRRWIEEPEPRALMLSSVFFDLRPVHGDASLYEDLSTGILEKSRKNRIFQAYMARNALSHQPPIGFFRNFVLASGGDHRNALDLKHTGVVPIVDLARVYALAGGVKAVNTFERLTAATSARTLSKEGSLDLIDALEYISLTRLRHQARLIREGRKADNFLEPDELSSFERSHLKAAFTVVKTMQASMAATYQLGRF